MDYFAIFPYIFWPGPIWTKTILGCSDISILFSPHIRPKIISIHCLSLFSQLTVSICRWPMVSGQLDLLGADQIWEDTGELQLKDRISKKFNNKFSFRGCTIIHFCLNLVPASLDSNACLSMKYSKIVWLLSNLTYLCKMSTSLLYILYIVNIK